MNEEIRKEINEAKIYKKLYLKNTIISDEILNEINKISYLETLWIENCQLNKFPINFTKFKNLKEISIINNNKLIDLPKEFSNFIHLKELYLSNSKFRKIPEIIYKLPKLKALTLAETEIKNFSGLEKLINLTHLDLRDNQLTKIPAQIFELTNLTSINLCVNKITKIPDEIIRLKNIRQLILCYNQVTDISLNISKLDKLSELDIDHNPTKYLKFYYKNIDDRNNFKYNYRSFIKEKEKKIELGKIEKTDFFNFKKIGYKINYLNTNLILIKTEKNLIIIEIHRDVHHSKLKEYKIESEHFNEYLFFIRVFGSQTTQKQILHKIRNHFNEWIENQGLEFKVLKKNNNKYRVATRFFNYYYKDKYLYEWEELIINYETLLELKNSGEYVYNFDNKTKIPVNDLLKYIEPEDNNKTKEQFTKNWQGTDYITKIRIKNLKLFSDIELKLDPKINILLGHNGLGKTTVLQGITMGLLKTENDDKSDNFSKFIKFNNERAEIYVNYGTQEQRIIHTTQNRLHQIQHIGFPSHILLSYGVNLNADTKIDTKFLDKIIQGNAKLYSTKSIFKDYSNDFNDPLLILYELHRTSELYAVNNKIIELVTNKINDYLKLIHKSERIELIKHKDRGHFYFKDINNNELQLENLSEGYKDHILLISDILFRIIAARNTLSDNNLINNSLFENTKGIILIDEFDRHLHPVWQRKLLLQLTEDFQIIQFILTTHNVFSVQSAVGATAHKIFSKENKLQIECEKIEAKNILAIIRKYFTKDTFDQKTQNLLNNFNKNLNLIYEGDEQLPYSTEFHNQIKQLINKNEELKQIIANDLMQLNYHLEKKELTQIELKND